jgi:hypothetical protein
MCQDLPTASHKTLKSPKTSYGGLLMRKFTGITMAVLFLATFISGFAEAHVHPGDSGHHTVIAILFMITICAHVSINFKAFTRYFGTPVKKSIAK